MNKRTIIIVIVSLIVAIGAGVGAALLVKSLSSSDQPPAQTEQTPAEMSEAADNAYEAALIAMNEGNKAEALKQLDLALKYYKEVNDTAGVENVEAQYDVAEEMPDPVPRTTVETQ